MAVTRTGARKNGLERARARREELDAERARRDQQIEEAAGKFFDAADEREELEARLNALDVERAEAIGTLTTLGEPAGRVTKLLDITPAELRRLRGLTASEGDDADASGPASGDGGTGESE